MSNDLDERKSQILWAVVDDYIASAEPVGSRTLAQKYNLGISPGASAHIRRAYSVVEGLSLLRQRAAAHRSGDGRREGKDSRLVQRARAEAR